MRWLSTSPSQVLLHLKLAQIGPAHWVLKSIEDTNKRNMGPAIE